MDRGEGGGEHLDQAGTSAGDGSGQNTLPSASAQAAASRITEGSRLGRYVILSELGSGGMGVVFAAYDPQLDRKVAIKLIRSDTGRKASIARARLQREAQALAQLAHPNVVSVHDVGVHDGQLFVSMEFVQGQTLGRWMKATPGPRPWREVLPTMVEAGRGLAAAHAAGLVHRDFKPDNVMLGDDGRVRVMDFGLARAADALPSAAKTVDDLAKSDDAGSSLLRSLTRTNAILGTPSYMSLEQFKGLPAGPPSDQFSFCVVLYEALYAERPFASSSIGELVHALSRGDVSAPPKATSVPAWLHQVIIRGLWPQVDRRWASMDDLLAALADDPTVRRRKWAAGTAVVTLLGISAWGLASTVKAREQRCTGMQERLAGAWDDDRRQQVRAALEATGKSYAPETWTRTEAGLDAYTQRWVADRTQACEAHQSGEQSDELLDRRMACLDERLRRVRATVDVLEGADDAVVERAVRMVARLPELSRCADTQALLAELPRPEDPAAIERVNEVDEDLAEVEALRLARKLSVGLERAQAAVARATTLGHEPLLVRALIRQAGIYEDSNRPEDAKASLEQAYVLALSIGMTFESAFTSARLMKVVGQDLGRASEGWRWSLDAEPLSRAAGTDGARSTYLTHAAILSASEGNYDKACEYQHRAIELAERRLEPDELRMAILRSNLGVFTYRLRSLDRARELQERVLATRERALGSAHPMVAESLINFANVLSGQGEHARAKRALERALSVLERALGPEHVNVAMCQANIGLAAAKLGQFDDARTYLERARETFERIHGPEHPNVAQILLNLGSVDLQRGAYEEARAHAEQTLAIAEQALGLEHILVADAVAILGRVALKDEDYATARERFERALTIRQNTLGPENPGLCASLQDLGLALIGLGESALSIDTLERALLLQLTADDPPELAWTRFVLAKALWAAPSDAGGDSRRALELAQLARAAFVEAEGDWAAELNDIDTWRASLSE